MLRPLRQLPLRLEGGAAAKLARQVVAEVAGELVLGANHRVAKLKRRSDP